MTSYSLQSAQLLNLSSLLMLKDFLSVSPNKPLLSSHTMLALISLRDSNQWTDTDIIPRQTILWPGILSSDCILMGESAMILSVRK